MSAASVMISKIVTARQRVICRRVSCVSEYQYHRTNIGWTCCFGGEKVVCRAVDQEHKERDNTPCDCHAQQ
jgi:hypothetical protein